MENNTKQVVVNFLNAVQAVDLGQLETLLHPEIQWKQPGNNQLSGVKNNRDEVFQMVGKMFELSNNTIKLNEYNSISVNGDKVACVLHWQAQNSLKLLNVINIDLYTVKNGQIHQAEIFTEDEEQEDDFWGK